MDPVDRDPSDDVPHHDVVTQDDANDDEHDAATTSPYAPLPDDPRLEQALDLLERGDNQAARRILLTIDDDDASDSVRRVRDEMLTRTAPDRFAVGVFVVSAILVIVVAWLAFRHSAHL